MLLGLPDLLRSLSPLPAENTDDPDDERDRVAGGAFGVCARMGALCVNALAPPLELSPELAARVGGEGREEGEGSMLLSLSLMSVRRVGRRLCCWSQLRSGSPTTRYIKNHVKERT